MHVCAQTTHVCIVLIQHEMLVELLYVLLRDSSILGASRQPVNGPRQRRASERTFTEGGRPRCFLARAMSSAGERPLAIASAFSGVGREMGVADGDEERERGEVGFG